MDTRKILDLRAKSKMTNAMPVEDRRTHPKLRPKAATFPITPTTPITPRPPIQKFSRLQFPLKIFDFPTFI